MADNSNSHRPLGSRPGKRKPVGSSRFAKKRSGKKKRSSKKKRSGKKRTRA